MQMYDLNSDIPRTLSGGIIGKVVAFKDTDGIIKVIKSYDDYDMLESEALSLEQIRSYGFNVPKILNLTKNPNQMTLEYIECEDHPDPRIIKAGIESLHALKSDTFGNYRDGFAFRLRVTNNKSSNWTEWWINNRWNILANSLEEHDRNTMNRITPLIPEILKDRVVVPSLIHGDYNDHNILVQKDTKKVYFIDSQCYFGDPYFEILQHKSQSISPQNVSNPIDLLYLVFIYGSLHKTLSFKNSYIWKSRICMDRLLDFKAPLWPSIYCEPNKHNYMFIVLICGTDIFNNEHVTNTIEIITNHCIKVNKCSKENILHVLFKTADAKYMKSKKKKDRQLIFERINDARLDKYVGQNICIDNSNFWTGTDVINRYKILFPNIKRTYVVCQMSNINNYKFCFADQQEMLVLNNGKYCANMWHKKVDII